jgi:hypothetical protein
MKRIHLMEVRRAMDIEAGGIYAIERESCRLTRESKTTLPEIVISGEDCL